MCVHCYPRMHVNCVCVRVVVRILRLALTECTHPIGILGVIKGSCVNGRTSNKVRSTFSAREIQYFNRFVRFRQFSLVRTFIVSHLRAPIISRLGQPTFAAISIVVCRMSDTLGSVYPQRPRRSRTRSAWLERYFGRAQAGPQSCHVWPAKGDQQTQRTHCIHTKVIEQPRTKRTEANK